MNQVPFCPLSLFVPLFVALGQLLKRINQRRGERIFSVGAGCDRTMRTVFFVTRIEVDRDQNLIGEFLADRFLQLFTQAVALPNVVEPR